MNIFNYANSHTKQGDIGEARAIYEYTRMGYTILKPLTDSDKFDLVVCKYNRFETVQVKTSKCKLYSKYTNPKSGFQVALSASGGNSTKNTRTPRQTGDYDLLFVLVSDNRCWSIPERALGDLGHSINVGSTRHGAKYTEYEILN